MRDWDLPSLDCQASITKSGLLHTALLVNLPNSKVVVDPLSREKLAGKNVRIKVLINRGPRVRDWWSINQLLTLTRTGVFCNRERLISITRTFILEKIYQTVQFYCVSK